MLGPLVALNGLWPIDNIAYCQSWSGFRDRAAVVWSHNRDGCRSDCSARSTGSGRIGPDPRLSRRSRCRSLGIWAPDQREWTSVHGPRSHKFEPRPKGRGRASLTVCHAQKQKPRTKRGYKRRSGGAGRYMS